MKTNLEDLHPQGLHENKELLYYYPNYKEEKEFIKSLRTATWEELEKYIEENYKNSNIYQIIKSPNFANEKVLHDDLMKQDVLDLAKVKFAVLNELLNTCKDQVAQLCDLIGYIVNYPDTYPVPTEEEINFEMEVLLKKYDIIIRYYLGDIEGLQIYGEAIKRLITTLNERVEDVKSVIPIMNNLETYIMFNQNKENMLTSSADKIKELLEFPLSYAQKSDESLWHEGKYYQIKHFRDLNGEEETKKFVMRLQKIMSQYDN